MINLILILTVAVSLSMDTFSTSIIISRYFNKVRQILLYSIIVGIMHFIMPFIGSLIGIAIVSKLVSYGNIITGIVFMFLALEMIINAANNKEIKFSFSFLRLFSLALLVSLDSFTVGIGIYSLSNNIIIPLFIFMICSFIFTYFGIVLGKILNNYFIKLSNYIGIVLMIILSIIFFCK